MEENKRPDNSNTTNKTGLLLGKLCLECRSTQNDLDKDGAILNRVKSGIAHQKHDMALNCSTPRVVKIDLDKYFNDVIKEL